MRGPAFTLIRDTACLAVGVFGILHQELTGRVSAPLLAVYTALLGVPGAIGLLALMLPGKGSGQHTAESSSQSPSHLPP